MKMIFNGELIDMDKAPCTSSGWLLGAGIFETIRTVKGQTYALGAHMERASKSAEIMDTPLPQVNRVRRSVDELVAAEPAPDGMLRISFDKNGDWAAVHFPYEPWSVPAKVRIHPDALISNGESIKSYPYDHRLAILEEAKILGFDEAIVTNTDGKVCEGAVSNLIFEIDGRWITPPTGDGALPGIMRALVIDNFEIEVASIPVTQIQEITSGILLGSLRIAQPIASINTAPLDIAAGLVDEIHAMAVLLSVG